MTPPDAICKFSALPAQRLRLINQGVLNQGSWAAGFVFDPVNLRDKYPFENPNQFSEGTESLPAYGVPGLPGGKMAGALPGKVRGLCYVSDSQHGLVP